MTDEATTMDQPGGEGGQQAASAADAAASALTTGLRQLYLAALGLPSALAEGMTHAFDDMVKRGEAIEPQTKETFRTIGKKVEDAAEKVGTAVETQARQAQAAVKRMGERMRATRSEGEPVSDDRLEAALRRMGVPTRDELKTVSDRIETLHWEISELRRRLQG